MSDRLSDDELRALGETEVRAKLKAGVWSRSKERAARDWLAEQERRTGNRRYHIQTTLIVVGVIIGAASLVVAITQ